MGEQNLTRQQLIDYFRDVFELEKQVYTYEMLEQDYEEMLTYVGVPHNFNLYINEQGVPGISPDYEGLYENSKRDRMRGITKKWRDELGHIIEKPEWLETQEYKDIDNIQPNDNSTRNRKALLIWKLICILIVIGLIVVLGFFSVIWLAIPLYFVYTIGNGFIDEKLFPISDKEFKDKEARKKAYLVECLKKEKNILLENEKPLRRNIENTLVESVVKPKENAKTLLNKVYSQDIIFPKYRNLVAVAQIYEYLLSARCDQLEGPNGAYNLYESELRQNIIISKLDEIIDQLDRLNHTMSTMCMAIQQTNSLLSGISSTLRSIDANTALTSYNTQCIAYNTQITNKYVL